MLENKCTLLQMTENENELKVLNSESNRMRRKNDFRKQYRRHRVDVPEAPPTVLHSIWFLRGNRLALLQNTRTGDRARMASPGMGAHPIRKRGPGRSAAVERRNLVTVCR